MERDACVMTWFRLNDSRLAGRAPCRLHARTGGWIRSAGFIFVALTVVPMLIGIHIGAYYEHEATGALVGALTGLFLAAWLVIRPVWLDADKDNANR